MAVPILAADDVVRVIVKAHVGTKMVVNIYHFGMLVPTFPVGGAPTLDTLLAAFRAWWRTNVLPSRPASYIVDEYRLTALVGKVANPTPTPARNYLPVFGGDLPVPGDPVLDVGGGLTDYLPSFNAMTVRLITGYAGRYWRGSSHIGPMLETNTTNQQVEAVHRAAQTTAWNTMAVTGFDADPAAPVVTFYPGVLSYLYWLGVGSGAPPQKAWVAWRPVTIATVNLKVGSMLNRKL